MAEGNWATIVVTSLQNMWLNVVGFLPNLIGALFVFIIGLIVAAGLSSLVEKILETVKFDSFLSKLGLTPYFERAGLRLRGARFLGQIVNWFFVVVSLLVASDILGLARFSMFLQSVVAFIPQVVIAVLIMLVAVVLGNLLKRVVSASVMSAQLRAANFLGTLTWWAVIVFGLMAALQQLDIASDLIDSLEKGFVAMLALAGGLAFGLGGKDYANHLINKLRDHTETR